MKKLLNVFIVLMLLHSTPMLPNKNVPHIREQELAETLDKIQETCQKNRITTQQFNRARNVLWGVTAWSVLANIEQKSKTRDALVTASLLALIPSGLINDGI